MPMTDYYRQQQSQSKTWLAGLGPAMLSQVQRQRGPCWHLHISERSETTSKEVDNLHAEFKMKLTKVPLQNFQIWRHDYFSMTKSFSFHMYAILQQVLKV